MSRLVRASLRGTTAALVFLAGLSSAHAEPEPIAPIQVTYTAEAPARACPTYEQFLAKVRRYTTKWRLAEGPTARSFRLVLAPKAPGATSGRLEIEELGKAPSVREIIGPDCEAVSRALAIALAVVIDPQADLSGGATDDAAENAPDHSAPPSAADPSSAAPPAQPPPLAARESSRPPLSGSPTASRLRLEAIIGLTTAVVDGVLPVIGANVELDPFARRREPHDRRESSRALPRWLSPSVALGFRQGLPRELERSGMTSQFLWTAGTLQLCPVRWSAFADRLELTPCFESNAGVLIASARGSRDSRSSTKPWLDLGGMAKVTWLIHRAWFVGGAFSVVAPVTRYRFELSTQAPVSQAPALGLAFGAVAGLGF